MNVPTIDICKQELKPGTLQWGKTKIQVVKALEDYGFFVAIFDEFPKSSKDGMFDVSKELFEFPLETKQRNFSIDKPHSGYLGQFPKLPCYESLCIVDLLQNENIETFARIFWPDGNPGFCNVVKAYYKPLVELDEIVKRMVLESLGLNSYIDEFLDLNSFLLRLTTYKATQGDQNGNQFGLGSHTDGNFLTIISQNQVNGLQVQMKNGDQWIDVNLSPNSFVVLLGDSFMAWTNGRLHSPLHRVRMAGDSDRFSIQLFSDPKLNCIIEAPKELVDEEHPLLFKPYDVVGYFEFLETEVGRRAAGCDTLKAYCGV